MSIYYDKNTLGFYDSEINTIPENSVEITYEYHNKLLQKQTLGLEIQPDKNGYPVALERVLSDEERIYRNESKKQQLINEAIQKIALLQDIIDLNMQESNEEDMLKKWKQYRILLTRIDTNQLDVKWPEQPE
ncbi:tail fiber assembly protein [Gilliamella sp. B3464]|uniref:tail fiber assembly protein n=1 Tax=unclassified Gilliamella TaxID=2685620 RepID=UPI00226AC0BD|nr:MULTISPECIES: tail fiber assembly protein [unclassified Gilliamella]MCX8712235.1 tail fiber assembly protein [Gilliamella sp. B3468]MCX8751219.1 tail fiber assembly protein [Gilliamella sp. B3464]